MSEQKPTPRSSPGPHGGEPRKTFAIISHPDAGKTTLTEKLLLYGGAVREAGAVAGKEGTKHATSDWMKLEQERGISITSAALQVHYQGHVLNLLDTPGHQDFSEDTYRTLTAADSAIMLLDGARGVQEQTEKLFTVSRRRGIPIFTFINKMDRPARDPLDLLDEVETALGIQSSPVTWPIGDGPDFRGVYERPTRQVHLFATTARNATKAPVSTSGVDDPKLAELLGARAHGKLVEEVEVIEAVLPPLDRDRFLAGEISPVFFGSVLTSFGVEPFLRHFLQLAPGPGPMKTEGGEVVRPADEAFTAFVFKLQANMNKQHRDRTAFARVVSGRFERGMHATHTRTGREIKLARAHAMFGQERTTVDEAFPGDVIGLINPGILRIGDVLSERTDIQIADFPRFAPETFATVRPKNAERHKAFRKGLDQLTEEGVVQLFYPAQGARDAILGAVGRLQFEVFQSRMQDEYGVDVEIYQEPFKVIRWLSSEPPSAPAFARLARDADEHPVALFRHERDIKYFQNDYPDLRMSPLPGDQELVRL